MINNNLYGISTPVFDFDADNSYSGYIPDKNQPIYYPQDSQRDIYMQQQVEAAVQQQLAQYIQQQQAQQQAQQYYNIRRGDTLGQIAAAHGMSVQDLARLNGINNINLIRAGQRLRFSDDLDNVYRDLIKARRANTRRTGSNTAKRTNTTGSTTDNQTIPSNPKRTQQVAKQERTREKSQGYMLSNVDIVYKKPVKKKQPQNSYSEKVPILKYRPAAPMTPNAYYAPTSSQNFQRYIYEQLTRRKNNLVDKFY